MTNRRQRGEGSIYQRAEDNLWVGRIDLGVINGKRKRKTVYGKTQAQCIRKMRDARKAIDKGVLTTRTMTMDTWLQHWITNVVPRRVKPKTLATYRSYVNQYLLPALGRVKLDKLTITHVNQLHDYVFSLGRSSTTASHAHRILGTALADAMRADLLERNVAAIESAPGNREAQRRPLTRDEFHRYMRTVEDDRLASRWLFGFLTGSRQGEVLGLRWDSVDLDGEVVDLATQLQRIPYKHGCGPATQGWRCGRTRADRCPQRALDVHPAFWHQQLDGNLCLQRPKTKGSTRVVPLFPGLTAALQLRHAQYLTERSNYTVDHDLVWARPDGRPIDGSDDRAAWTTNLATAGIPHTDQHSMRHATSTILLSLGVEEHVRMSILGHSEEAVNRRYSHVDLSLQRDAMHKLGTAMMGELTSS